MQKTSALAAWSVLIATGLLGGCHRSGDRGKTATATAEGVEVAAVTPAQSGGPGDPAALTIQVFQEDSDAGVAAEIDRLDDTDGRHHVVDVDDSGVAKLMTPCSAGERFAAKPRVAAFLHTAPRDCAATITFRLYSAKATYALIQIADNATQSGDLLVAQANYGLAADRLQYTRPEEAEHLNILASAAAGRILGVETPTLSVGGKETVSSEMVDRLKAYQRAVKVPESGVLDAATREAIGKVPPAQVLSYAVESSAPATDASPPLRSALRAAEIQAVALSPSAATQARVIQKRMNSAEIPHRR